MVKRIKHRHRVALVTEVPFAGPVGWPETPAAHGNICRVETCACGAVRRVNVNFTARETGPWVRTSGGEG